LVVLCLTPEIARTGGLVFSEDERAVFGSQAATEVRERLAAEGLIRRVAGTESNPGYVLRHEALLRHWHRSTVESNLQIHEDIMPPPAPYSDPVPSSAPASPDPASGQEASASDALAEPAVAGSSEGPGEGATDGLPEEPYWTARGGRLLHRRTCAWRRRVAVDAVVPVKALTDGLDQGLQPCPVCDPKEAAPAPA
jgi:hypothetical protein